MIQAPVDLKTIANAMKPTGVFLSEWQNKPDCRLLMVKEGSGSNYMVMRDRQLILWARTIDLKESQVFIHSRQEMVARMGEAHIRQLEESFSPSVH